MRKSLLIIAGIFLALFLTGQSYAAENEAKQDAYFIEVSYQPGNVSFGQLIHKYGYLRPFDFSAVNSPEYRLEIVSYSGKVLENYRFGFELPEVNDDGPLFDISEKPKAEALPIRDVLVIPYHKEGGYARIYAGKDELMAEKNLSEFAQVCGDKTCEPHENYALCPMDCPETGKDRHCSGNPKDADCVGIESAEKITAKEPVAALGQQNAVTEKKSRTGYAVFFLIGFGLLAVSGLAIYFIRSRKKPGPDDDFWNNNKSI